MTVRTTVGRVPVRAVLASCTFALVVASCGSSSTSSSPTTAGTTAPTGSPAAAPTTSPKGTPIKIMVESSVNTPIGSFPGTWGGAQAAAAAVNRSGGAGGHPLVVELCNASFSVNGAVACARKAVSDKVVAYMGFTPFAFAITPILKPAGITMSPFISSLSDAENPSILPINGGGEALEQTAEPLVAKLSGGKSVAIALTDYPGLGAAVTDQIQSLHTVGIPFTKVIHLSVAQTDTTATVQQLAQLKPTTVILETTASQEASILQTAQSIGFRPTWISSASQYGPSSMKDVAQLTHNMWIASLTPSFQSSPSNNAAYAHFDSEMNAAVGAGLSNAGQANRDDSSFFAWSTAHALASVGATLSGPVTAANFGVAVSKTTNLDVTGLWKWTPAAAGGKLFPHETQGGPVFIGTLGSGGTYTIKQRVPVLTKLGLG